MSRRPFAPAASVRLCAPIVGLLLLAPALAAAADLDWSWGHPRPQGNPVFGLVFQDDQTGWAVARGGQVLRTDDGAVTWHVVQGLGGVGADLMDIVQLPGGALIAGGDGLHRSTDGGFSWELLSVPAAGPFHDLTLIPGGGVSAGGDGGAVVVSTDGGTTWTDVGPGTGVIRHHLWRSATEAYVVGDWTNLHTVDGGVTWTPTFPLMDPLLNEVFFTGPDTGFIAEAFKYWVTTDGGATWQPGPDFDGGPLYRYRTLLVSPDHWLVTAHGEGGELWETLDGGATWTQLHFSWHVGYPAIAALPGGRVVVAGDDGGLFRSDDLGHTLVLAGHNVGAATVYATVDILAARPDGTLFAYGDPSVSGIPPVWMRSDDGGFNWTDGGDLDEMVKISNAIFVDDAIGLAGGWNTVLRSADGGATWAPASWAGGGWVRGFAAPAPDNVFLAGSNGSGGGSIYRSTDGGQTWAPVGGGLPVGTFDVWAVRFGSPLVGLVSGNVGGLGRTYRTTDGGATWALVGGLSGAVQPGAWPEPDVVFGSVGQDVVRSLNGGLTWQTVGVGRGSALAFRDADEGVAWSTHGGLHRTEDGGQTWTPLDVPFRSPIPPATTYTWIGAATWSEAGLVVGSAELRILVGADPAVSPVPPTAGPVVRALRLDDPWPNPANPMTDIRFHLAEAGPVLVTVHDVAGRRVRTVVRENRAAGAHVVTWHGDDDAGRPVASGLYLVQAVSRGNRATAKLTLVK
ncbi:hypothetical protein KDM41_12855 [bacterium]|nr:hypothetical protein [bacterium]